MKIPTKMSNQELIFYLFTTIRLSRAEEDYLTQIKTPIAYILKILQSLDNETKLPKGLIATLKTLALYII